MENAAFKSNRLLQIFVRLQKGETLNKQQLAQQFGVTQRSIQRDVESLRCFLAEQHSPYDVVYDRSVQGYRLHQDESMLLSNSEVLAACKILLESRSMCKGEMFPILNKMIANCVPEENRKAVEQMLANEKFHYIEPRHNKPMLEGLWEIGQAVQHHQIMEIEYERMKEPKLVKRRVQPVGIMFSEYYFYLTAFLENKEHFDNPDDLFPTIYRIDRIQSFRVLDEHFYVPYKDRFQEGEFRKRVQFMYGGKLERIRFRYTGPSIEAVLDRLPTAQIVEEDGQGWTVEAEAFGKGIEMWLRSQGDYIQAKVLPLQNK